MKSANISISPAYFLLLAVSMISWGCDRNTPVAPPGPGTEEIPFFSSVQPSLVGPDHTAEGFLVTLDNGNILHFFRLDPGLTGHHVGSNGRIVSRLSRDNGNRWEDPVTIFDSQYDDRNVHGGMTSDGRIVLTFRRYDPDEPVEDDRTIDINMIYSEDGGSTWSDRQEIVTDITNMIGGGTHRMIHVPTRGYLLIFYAPYYLELRFSVDGTQWDDYGMIWDYRESQEFYFDEACFAYIGNGRLIGLIRDETKAPGSTFYQLTSSDFGVCWTQPARTNIADGLFCPSPQLFMDNEHDRLWVITSDRRGYHDGYQNEDSEIWVYVSDPEVVFDDPLGHSLSITFPRPDPNPLRFYGYPAYTELGGGDFLVVFTEDYQKENGLEDADFHQFTIRWMSPS